MRRALWGLLLAMAAQAGPRMNLAEFNIYGGTVQIWIGITGESGPLINCSGTARLGGTLQVNNTPSDLNAMSYGAKAHLLHAAGGVSGYTDPELRFVVYPALPLGWYVIYTPTDVYIIKTKIQHRVTLR